MITGGSAVDGVEVELRRVGTRLVALGPVRVLRPGPDGVAPADRVRPVLQDLADRAADLEGRPRRAVPALAPHALADQLVVLARDVVGAARGDEGVADAVHRRLVELRRAL